MAGIERGYRPQPKEAAFQADPPGGEVRNQGRPISLRDELSLWTRETLGSNPPLKLWAAMDDVDTGYIRLHGDAASKEAAWKVKWAFYVITSPYMDAIEEQERGETLGWASPAPQIYDQLKEEQRERGEDQPFIDLNREQTNTLRWALETAGIPFDAQVNEKGNLRVALLPLEHEAAGVQFARTREQQDVERAAIRRSYGMPEKRPEGKMIDLEAKRNERTH